MTTATKDAVTVDHKGALDALGQADWHLCSAYMALVPVLHAAIYLDGAEPDVLAEAMLAAIRETAALEARFTEAQGRDGQ